MNKQASQERQASSANGFVYVIAGLLIAFTVIFLVPSRPSPLLGLVFGIGMLTAAWCSPACTSCSRTRPTRWE